MYAFLNEPKLLKKADLAPDRDELKKLLKEKGVKSLDDLNAFVRGISKEVVERLLESELTDQLG